MKDITIISDTHSRHQELKLPGGDLLIHCGDIMSCGRKVDEVLDFLQWFGKQNYKYKIFIAGNHDRIFEECPDRMDAVLKNKSGIYYLQDSQITIDGLKIYGTPWSREFCGWAFSNKTINQARKRFGKIPADTDILITHTPPFGILDQVLTSNYDGQKGAHQNPKLGCKELLNRVLQVKPKLHCFGHIHSSQGQVFDEESGIVFNNAACLDENYDFGNKKKYTHIDLN